MPHHVHPYSEEVIEGYQLGLGDRIEKTDRYASTNGKWMPPGQSVGIRIESTKVIWVRPIKYPDPKQPRIAHKATVTAK